MVTIPDPARLVVEYPTKSGRPMVDVSVEDLTTWLKTSPEGTDLARWLAMLIEEHGSGMVALAYVAAHVLVDARRRR